MEPALAEVQEELQAVLASRSFRQSRNLAKLLRYLCSQALLGSAANVTEYSIAVDVLGKPLDYKEVKDASVRVEVHRLRKRLAQYYEEEGAGRRVRIQIPPGGYVPVFLYSDPAPMEAGDAPPAEAVVEPEPADDGAADALADGSGQLRPAGLPVQPSPTPRAPEPLPAECAPLVLAHLEDILASVPFRGSKRYAAVLRYIVERSLSGSTETLKERSIGEAVFGRAPDYDTSEDHVVRSAMAEVRKRLGLYYQQVNNPSIVIELQPGAYAAHFAITPPAEVEAPVDELPLDQSEPAADEPPETPKLRRRFALPALLAAGLLAAVAVCWFFFGRETPMDAFWKPVLAGPGEVLLCVGDLAGRSPSGVAPVSVLDYHASASHSVHANDAATTAQFAALLAARGKPFRVVSQSEATFGDLQKSSAILIGLRNNDWTSRITGGMRYTVAAAGPGILYIQDRQNPDNKTWSVDYAQPFSKVTRDYALALRTLDPKTGHTVVAAAGITVFGTMAAGEFLTDPQALSRLAAMAPKGWKGHNVEVVLAAEVMHGSAGHPEVLATKFW